jgi:hypothetical protein
VKTPATAIVMPLLEFSPTTFLFYPMETENSCIIKLKICKMPRKKNNNIETPKSGRPSFHESLKGFDIKVNSFGEMESTFEIDRINDFLNKEVHDKKLETPESPTAKTKASVKKKKKEEEE